ncbi:uncharacterized protein V1518DRAFT_422585 [Limtongia smithiae]|uniref:uncharacterized protein n=1 Tax=Limtongia smithiae TaxID=1125753 RepID=UPI0034CE8F9A
MTPSPSPTPSDTPVPPFVVSIQPYVASHTYGFHPPSFFTTPEVQARIEHNRLLDRGYMDKSVLAILATEATKDMFSAYELVNLIHVPCVRETVATALSIGSITGAVSWISSRNMRRSQILFLVASTFVSLPAFLSCKQRRGQLTALSDLAEMVNAKRANPTPIEDIINTESKPPS